MSTPAAVAMAFSKFLGVLFPWFSETNIWFEAGFLKFNTVHIAAISSILLLSWINAQGIKTGKIVQNLFTYSKVGILLVFIIAGFFFVKNNFIGHFNS